MTGPRHFTVRDPDDGTLLTLRLRGDGTLQREPNTSVPLRPSRPSSVPNDAAGKAAAGAAHRAACVAWWADIYRQLAETPDECAAAYEDATGRCAVTGLHRDSGRCTHTTEAAHV